MSEQTQHVIEYNITDAALTELAERHAGINAYEDFTRAKEAKKECQELRLAVETRRKDLKADALAYGRAVDDKARGIQERIAEVEEPLTKQLNEIRDAEKRKEEERLAQIDARIQVIRDLGEDLGGRGLPNLRDRLSAVDNSDISEETFQEFREQAIGVQAEAASKLRIAIKRQEEVEAEQARLEEQRKEQEEREAELKAREEALAKEQAEREEKERKEREEREAEEAEKRKEEEERLRKEREKLEKEKREIEEEKERIAAEEKAEREEKEAKEKAEREERERIAAEERRLAAAPDVEKLELAANRLAAFEWPTLSTDAGNRVRTLASESLSTVVAYLQDEARKMK
jgi:hypothetical protein